MVFPSKKKGGSQPRHNAESSPSAKQKRKKKVTSGAESLTYIDYKLVINEDGQRMYVSPEEAKRVEALKRVKDDQSGESLENMLKTHAEEENMPLPTPVEVIDLPVRKSRKDSSGEKKRGFFERAFSSGRKQKEYRKNEVEDPILGLGYKLIVTDDGRRMYVPHEEAMEIERQRGNLPQPSSSEELQIKSHVGERSASDTCLLGEDEEKKVVERQLSEELNPKFVGDQSASETRDSFKSLVQSSNGDTIYETPINSSTEQEDPEEEKEASSDDGYTQEKSSDEIRTADEVVLSSIPSTPKKMIVEGWIEGHRTDGEFPQPPPVPESPPPDSSNGDTPPVNFIDEESHSSSVEEIPPPPVTPPPLPKVPPPLPKCPPPSSSKEKLKLDIKTALKDIESDDPLPPTPVKVVDIKLGKTKKPKKRAAQPNFFNRLFSSGRKVKRIHTLDEVLHTDTDGDADSESSESEEEMPPKAKKFFGVRTKNRQPKEKTQKHQLFSRREKSVDQQKKELGLNRISDADIPKVLIKQVTDDVPEFEYLDTHSNQDSEKPEPKKEQKSKFGWFGLRKSKSGEISAKKDTRRNHSFWSSDSELVKKSRKQRTKKSEQRGSELVESYMKITLDTSSDDEEENFKRTFSFGSLWKREKQDNRQVQSDKETDSEPNPTYGDIFLRRSKRKTPKKAVKDKAVENDDDVDCGSESSGSYYKKTGTDEPMKPKEGSKWSLFGSKSKEKRNPFDEDVEENKKKPSNEHPKIKEGPKWSLFGAKPPKTKEHKNKRKKTKSGSENGSDDDTYKNIPSEPRIITEGPKWSLFGAKPPRKSDSSLQNPKIEEPRAAVEAETSSGDEEVLKSMDQIVAELKEKQQKPSSASEETTDDESDVEKPGPSKVGPKWSLFGTKPAKTQASKTQKPDDEITDDTKRTKERSKWNLFGNRSTRPDEIKAKDKNLDRVKDVAKANRPIMQLMTVFGSGDLNDSDRLYSTDDITCSDSEKEVFNNEARTEVESPCQGTYKSFDRDSVEEDVPKKVKTVSIVADDPRKRVSKKPDTSILGILGLSPPRTEYEVNSAPEFDGKTKDGRDKKKRKEKSGVENSKKKDPESPAQDKTLFSIFGSSDGLKGTKKKNLEKGTTKDRRSGSESDSIEKTNAENVITIVTSSEDTVLPNEDEKTSAPRGSVGSSRVKPKFTILGLRKTDPGEIHQLSPDSPPIQNQFEDQKITKPSVLSNIFGSRGKLEINRKSEKNDESESEKPGKKEKKEHKTKPEENGITWLKMIRSNSEKNVAKKEKFSIFERSGSVEGCSSVSSVEGTRGSYDVTNIEENQDKSGSNHMKSDSGLDCRKSSISSVSSGSSSGRGGLAMPAPAGKWGPKKTSLADLRRSTSGEYCFMGDAVERADVEAVVLRSFKIFDDDGKARPVSMYETGAKKLRMRPLSVHVPVTIGSDTESADHGSTDKSSVSKLTESGVKKNRFAFLDLMKKSKSKNETVEEGNVNGLAKETASAGVDTQQTRDGVVYAELDIVRGGETAAAMRAKNAEPEKTEYAEIIHPAPPLSKKEELRKSRENLADMDAVTTTPDGKKEAAV